MSAPAPSTYVRSRRIVLATGELDGALLVEQGKVRAVVGADEMPAGATVDDLGELALLPGVVDTHVHVNAPGRDEWEGWHSAGDAAAAGGVTTIVDMPLNSIPATTNVAALQVKRAAAEGASRVDFALWGGVVPGNVHELDGLTRAGACGFKCFMVDSGVPEFAAVAEADLELAMPELARLGLPLLAHAELPGDQPAWDGPPTGYAQWVASRPPEWELRAIKLLAVLAHRHECRVHVVHLATAQGAPSIEASPWLSAETCPHYLTFCGDEIPDGRTEYKCAPPIRDRDNREALWQLVLDGHVQLIASDHSPAPAELKHVDDGDLRAAWGGIASLQVSLPATWSGLAARGGSLRQLATLMSVEPARLAGLERKIARWHLQPGAAVGADLGDADIVAFDPDGEFVVDARSLLHRHALTPYDGVPLRGRVHATYLRGVRIYDRGNVAGDRAGRFCPRGD